MRQYRLLTEDMMQDLLEEAYQCFAPYRAHVPLAICSCDVCMTLEEQRAFLALPLRDISAGWMGAYVSSVPREDEAAYLAEYRYFLPRLLELLATDEDVSPLTETSLAKMHLAHPAWSTAERDFMRRFAHVFIAGVVHSGAYADNVANYILMFHWAGLEIAEELTAIWTEHAHKLPALRDFLALLEYLDVTGGDIAWHKALHLPDYCPDRDGFTAVMSAWFTAPQTLHTFRQALEAVLLSGQEDPVLTPVWEVWYDWFCRGEK